MSSALQNRLVGTIILVAIAVIFLPDMLDGKEQSKRNLFVELPKKPLMIKVQAPQEMNVQSVKEAATRQVEVVTERALDETPKDADSEKSSLDPQPGNEQMQDESETLTKPEALSQETPKQSDLAQQTVVRQEPQTLLNRSGWVVQLGSFRHQKNVQDLLTLLEKAGYRAFSRPVKTNSGTLTKVFVGPDLQKDNLEEALSHLKELTKLQGRVTPFTVQ